MKEGQGTEEVNIQMLGETWALKGEEPETGVNYGAPSGLVSYKHQGAHGSREVL